jgi:glycerol-1-phosphate dehydrogenase [NAD(P)+]
MIIMDSVINLKAEELIGMDFECACGKRQTVEINAVNIGENIIEKLPEFLKDFKNRKILIVEDVLKHDYTVKKYIFKKEHLLAG